MTALDGYTPGDEDAYVGFAPEVAQRWYRRLDRLAHAIGARVDGLERIPAGPVLLVANHTFGWDVALAVAAIARATDRR